MSQTVPTQYSGSSTVQQGHQQQSRSADAGQLPQQYRQSLSAVAQAIEVCGWCADKCIETGPEMAECARLCNDLADIAELNEKLIARDSINGPEVAETFLRVAQQGMPILQQYQQTPHVQETLQAVEQATETTNRLLSSIGGQQGFQEMAQQMQGSQMGQQGGQMGQQGGQMCQQGGQMGQQSQGQFGQSY